MMPTADRPSIDLKDVFHPKSIVVIGASSDDRKERNGWTGTLLNFGFEGRLYPVNPKARTVLGLRAYPSVRAIEGEVDYAIVNLKPPLVPKALEECADKGVKVVHIFTSGFAELGDEQGKRLQEEVGAIAPRTGLRLIGPNCMGVHCPEGGMSFANLPRKTGPAALISQTGAGAVRVIAHGNNRGVYFGRAVSYGNAVDLDSTDFLDMLARDDKTRFIALYVESVRDGRRLLSTTRACVSNGKPVVVLKAGSTEGARRALTSHTGAMAGSEEAWKAFFAQSGAIRVDTLEEIVDQLVALQNLPQPRGRRVGIIGRGGGPGIIATEICERANLRVPTLPTEAQKDLERITSAAGGSMIRNPVEVGIGRAGAQAGYVEAFRILAQSDAVDMILTHLNPDAFILYGGTPAWVDQTIDALLRILPDLPKPVVLVLPGGETKESREVVREAWLRCSKTKLAVFHSYQSAAKALDKLMGYYEFRDRVLGVGGFA